MTNRPLMRCGHVANTDTANGPACASCIGIGCDGTTVEQEPPDLRGRVAVCRMCVYIKDSSFDLPQFKYERAGLGTDTFYCGCRGWD